MYFARAVGGEFLAFPASVLLIGVGLHTIVMVTFCYDGGWFFHEYESGGVKTQVNNLFLDGSISTNEYDAFFKACFSFHEKGFLYAFENFPLNNQLLKHVRVIDYLNQKSSCERIQFLVEKLQNYVKFTPKYYLS